MPRLLWGPGGRYRDRIYAGGWPWHQRGIYEPVYIDRPEIITQEPVIKKEIIKQEEPSSKITIVFLMIVVVLLLGLLIIKK